MRFSWTKARDAVPFLRRKKSSFYRFGRKTRKREKAKKKLWVHGLLLLFIKMDFLDEKPMRPRRPRRSTRLIVKLNESGFHILLVKYVGALGLTS